MDHRAIIASLSPADRASLTEKADAPGLARLAFHAGTIAALAAAVACRAPYWPALLPPLGILIVFLSTLEHEAIHETAFRTRRLNTVVAAAVGVLMLLPPAWFRYFHFAHHRHTHDPDNDPELMAPEPVTTRDYLIYLSGWRYWYGMAKAVVLTALGRADAPYIPPKGRARVMLESRLLLGVYAALAAISAAAGSTLLLWVWIVPALIGQPFLRAYLLAEHGRCPPVANMLENTRTTFTNALVRLIAWNMPYHAEHHAYPAVPFHRLPEFHRITAPHLRTTERGYARFHGTVWRGLGADAGR